MPVWLLGAIPTAAAAAGSRDRLCDRAQRHRIATRNRSGARKYYQNQVNRPFATPFYAALQKYRA
jgi:hypothetical protein